MAIIRSLAVGKARKSAGNLTFRTVRGRTIASEKVGKASTRVVNLSRMQALFKMVTIFMQAHATDIQVSFNKSMYGSQRNYFFRINKVGLEAALSNLIATAVGGGLFPTLETIEGAIKTYATNNPNAIFRVKLDGFAPVMLKGEWTSADNPVSGAAVDALGTGSSSVTSGDYTYSAPIALSMNYHAGARIVRESGNVELRASALKSGATAAQISYVNASGTAVEGLAVTNVTSASGRVAFSSPAIAEGQNVVAIKIGDIYVRLTSAYTRSGGSTGGDGGME